MQSDKRSLFNLAPMATEATIDYRRRAEELAAQAAERRQQQLEEQSSPLNSAAVRIQAWERLHQLTLPRDPRHRLIQVIAANTGLSVDEILAEQVDRAAAGK